MEDLLPVFIDLKMIKCPLQPMRQKAGSICFPQVDEMCLKKPHGTTEAIVCDVCPWESG